MKKKTNHHCIGINYAVRGNSRGDKRVRGGRCYPRGVGVPACRGI